MTEFLQAYLGFGFGWFLATLILIPLTFSITQGILWGFILHAVLHAVAGRARDVSRPAWGLAAVAAALLVIEHAH